MRLGTMFSPRQANVNRGGRRLGGLGRMPRLEGLEPRHMLAGSPAVLTFEPVGVVTQPTAEMRLQLSDAVVGDGARLASSYELLHLGADRLVGGNDDQAMSILPVYIDGGTQISLLSPASLNNWQEFDYAFPAGIHGDWQLSGGGTSVAQTVDGGMTFFVSDNDFVGGRFSARIKVDGAATDDDFVGVVFGLRTNPETQLPDQYYLLSWKRTSQAGAEAGLKLAKITGTGQLGQRPDLWDLDDADPHISLLREGPETGWTAGVDYDVHIDYAPSGAIRAQVVEAFTGQVIWDATVQDASPLGAGKVGFYNFGQAATRYDSLSFLSSLPDGYYQLTARSSDEALRGLDGSLLDGNNNGVGGDDFLGTFGIDTAPATISVDLRSTSDTGKSNNDNITRLMSLTFDVTVSEIGRINIDYDGNNTVDATQFAATPGTYSFTRNYAAAGAYSVVASFQAASGETPQATLPIVIDTRGPTLVTPLQQVTSPWSSIAIEFNEPVDAATFGVDDVQFTSSNGSVIPLLAISRVDASYTLSFAEQNAAGTYLLRVGPQIADRAGNLMNQDGDTTNGESADDVAIVPISFGVVEQSVLFVNVNGSYNADGWHFYQTLLQAGAHAQWANLASTGQVSSALQSTNFDQIWVYDLSSAADNYPTDWQAIGDWFNADPSRAIVADGRIISSYWNGRNVSEGARLTENYYENLKLAGGGLLLGTDHNDFQSGINSINDRIGIERFSGNFSLATIPVDTGNPLMNTPNDLGSHLFDDSTPGQTPYGLQPNGRILYSVAWHSGNINTPGISSTIRGEVDLRVEIVSPTSGAQFAEGQHITFTAIATNTTPPVTYAWMARPAGDPQATPIELGSEATVQTLLLPGSYLVTVVSQDASGSADDDAILVTVQAIPGSITLDLVPESDSGFSTTDNITFDTTPTFQASVNKAGTITLDYDNDGSVDETVHAPAAGIYTVTAPELADGGRPVRATFTPLLGSTAQATLNVTIDTQSPTLAPGQPSEQSPLSQRTVTFSEPIVGSTFTVAGTSLTGPAATGPLAVISVNGSGATYVVGFSPLFVAGTYSLGIPASVVDLAGNAVAPDATATFALLADTTRPFVMSYSPVGVQGADVTRLTARFNEPILAASFTIGDVAIVPPTGAAAPQISLVRLLPDSDREFEVVFSQPLATTGTYQVAVGPNITDLSGNVMNSAYLALFTIDKTGPQVTAMVPSGIVMQVVSFVDVTFDEPINGGTFTPADVTINGPAGFINANSVARLSGNTYRIHFASQRTNGAYSVQIGPNIADVIGNTMNQGPGAFSGQFTIGLPDLVVDVPISAPGSGNFGEPIAVSWTTRNVGAKDALGNWTDRVWLSTNAVLDKSGSNADLLLHTQPAILTPLATSGASASYLASAHVSLPLVSTLPTGTYYLIVETDAGGTVVESNEANNATASNGIVLTRPALADLVVTDILAPATALPGTSVPLSWTVANQGTASASGPWTERVYLSADHAVGNDQLLATFTYSGLGAGVPVTRNEVVALPSHGIAGNVWFVVETDAGNAVVEVSEVNAAIDDVSMNIPLGLSLMLTHADVREDAGAATLRGVVTRNGPATSPLVVTIATSDGTELTAPATVTIPAGQLSTTVTLTPVQDDQVDGPQSVTVSASATGYTTALGGVVVLDVDQPALSLSIDAASLVEGVSATATLSRDYVSASPVTVLVATNRAQLNVPLSVTIPANEASITFTVAAVDDELVEATRSVSVDVSAGGFTAASAAVSVVDNDVPSITLQILPNRISEGTGGMAAGGVVTRSIVSHQPLVVLLRSLDTSELTVPDRVTIPADQASASFTLNAVDDTDVDGEQIVTILAMVTETTTRTPLPGVEATAQITVTDNDGPTLRITFDRDLVAEGMAAAATGTVTRNTPPIGDLLVQLASDRTGELTVPPTVLIPNGQSSATFAVTTIEDFVADGNQTVTVTASTTGYTSGTRSIVVSDVDLPDLVVRSIGVPATATTEQYFDVSYRVGNDGIATAIPTSATPPTPGTWQERVFLSSDPYVGDDTLIGNFTFTGNLPVGQSFERTIPVRAPQKPGNYWIIVTTDLNNTVIEGLESNNTRVSDSPAVIQAEYTASVQTNVDVGLAGQPVPLSGQAVKTAGGQPMPFALVNVHVSVRGTKRVISVITDATGRFNATFAPLPGEGGHFTIGASHPGLDMAPVQDEFMLLGIRAEPSRGQMTVTETQSASGQITIRNTSDVPLAGLSVEVLSKPTNLTVTASLATTFVDSLGTVALNYGATAADASAPSGVVTLRIRVPNGPTLDVPIDARIIALAPRLELSPQTLLAGMTRGEQSLVEFAIKNVGGRDTGPLEIQLPDIGWLTLAVDGAIPSIQPNGEAKVTLLLDPPTDLSLGAHRGTVIVGNSEVSAAIPFTFESVSAAKGDLSLEIVDEYSFYAEDRPRVAGARVLLVDQFDGTIVAEGTSNVAGQVELTDIAEGYYALEVTAPDHTSYRRTIFVPGGRTDAVQIFISRNVVRYTFDVIPITIEDTTRIEVQTTFETNVPVPVVVIEPAVINYDDLVFANGRATTSIKLSNHGLIAAEAVSLRLPEHPNYTFLTSVTDIGLLPARSSLTLPVTIEDRTFLASSSSARVEGHVDIDGISAGMRVNVVATNTTLGESTTTATNESGDFSFNGLSPGRYTFSIPKFKVRSVDPTDVVLSGGDIFDSVVVRAERLGVLQGTILGAGLTPVQDAVVTVLTSDDLELVVGFAVSDEGGAFAVPGMAGGPFRLLIEAPGYERTWIDDVGFGDGLQVSLRPEAILQGHVTINQMPLEGGILTLRWLPHRSGPLFTTVIDEGQFALGGLPEGSYILTISHNGTDVFSQEVDIDASQTYDLGNVALISPAGSPGSANPSQALLDFKNSFIRWQLPALGTWLGDDAFWLWSKYLFSIAPNLTPSRFTDGSQIVEDSFLDPGIGNGGFTGTAGFRYDSETEDRLQAIFDLAVEIILDRLEKDSLEDCGAKRRGDHNWYFDIEDLAKDSAALRDKLIEVNSANYSNIFTIPGNTAGGPGPAEIPSRQPSYGWGQKFDDARKVYGQIRVEFPDSPFLSNVVRVHSELIFDVLDTVDFEPGQLGAGLEHWFGTPMLRELERNGLAYDVPFNVVFTDKDRFTAVPRKEYRVKKCCDQGTSGGVGWSLQCGPGTIDYGQEVRLAGFGGQCTTNSIGVSTAPDFSGPTLPVYHPPYETQPSPQCSSPALSPGAWKTSVASDAGICAQVTVQIDQSIVQAREAFEASLKIINDAGSRITELKVDVFALDTTGANASDVFDIRLPVLNGVDDVSGTGAVPPGGVADARWIFVPSASAAPSRVTEYFVGGLIEYEQDGRKVSIDLRPVRIEVHPIPQLRLKYFQERDVFSDDPFTSEIEPAIPFSLGVIATNSGGGAATNLRIESVQPHIIENVKGLDTRFTIIGTEVNGAALQTSLTAVIGDVAPAATAVALWRFVAPIHGHFVDMAARIVHQDPRTSAVNVSLVQSVSIHKTLHVIRSMSPHDDGRPDFLTDDVTDPDRLPDTIHFSDGSVANVGVGIALGTDAPPIHSDLNVKLSAAMSAGWSYLKFADPGLGDYRLVRVVRSDGTELPTANFWQTDRTFIEQGQRPLLEDNIHIVDYNGTGSYTLVFASDSSAPIITMLETVSPDPRTTPVDLLTVTFSKAVDPSTVSVADISLRRDGQFIPLGGTAVAIAPVDATNRSFRITGLGALTADDAEYALTIDASGVADLAGNAGLGTATETWLKADAAPTIVSLSPVAPVTSVPVDTFDVTFSEPINLATFDADSLVLRRDGQVIGVGTITFVQNGAATYRISGLAAGIALDGVYTLTVSAAPVTDLVGTTGVGSASTSWTVDTTAPTIVDVVDVSPDPRAAVVSSIDVLLSEAVDLATFDYHDVSLVRDGGANLLTSGVTISHVSGTRYRISGLSGITAASGTYQLTVNLAGVQDAAGNAGTGAASDTWVVDTTPPAAATNLRIVPDTGVSTADGRTNVLQMNLLGDLGESGLRVDVFDLTTGTPLGSVASAATQFNLPIQFSVVGTHLVRVRVTDAAGNTADATLTVFIDTTLPVVTSVTGAPTLPSATPVDTLDVTFSEPIDLGSFATSDIALTLYGTPVAIPTAATFAHLSGNTYRLSGIAGATATPGRYSIVVGGSNFVDLAGNIGAGFAEASWINADINDSLGPRVSRIWVSGSDWTDEFKEELARRGLGEHGYALVVGGCDQLLDLPWTNINQIVVEFAEDVFVAAGDLQLEGLNRDSYPVLADQFQYDPTSRRAVWTMGGRIGADKLLLTVSDRVTDLVGNPLDGEWSNVIGQYPSGDGQSGGDFRFLFTVLPGDVTRNEAVDQQDVLSAARRAFSGPLQGVYDPFHDVDADGYVTANDLVLIRNHEGISLPTGNLQGGSHPASVTNVLFSSSRWSTEQRTQIDPALGLGMPISVGTCDQFQTIAMSWLDQVSIVFSENMVVSAEDLQVIGVNQASYSLAAGGFAYDATNHVATWTLAQPILADKILLKLADTVQSVGGRALDGEWTDIAQVFSSGDGIPGGDFTFRFNALAGDWDHDGSANAADARAATVAVLQRNVGADVNLDGVVTFVDAVLLRDQSSRSLPAGEPTLPAGSAAAGAVVRRARAARIEALAATDEVATRPSIAIGEHGLRAKRRTPTVLSEQVRHTDAALSIDRDWTSTSRRVRARAHT